MSESILSVKTQNLIEKTWEMLTDKSSYFESQGKDLNKIFDVYNELCKCNKAIRTCDSEKEYAIIEKRVNTCETAIKNFA